jgi:Fibronectin type III domain
MSDFRISTPDRLRMNAVHALGHPASPPPQTRWLQSLRNRAGEPPSVANVAAPSPMLPNAPAAPSLQQGTPSGLIATWSAPAIDSTHGSATEFNLQFSPSGAGTWTLVSNVTSPYDLTDLASGASYDVQVQATNGAGGSTWSDTATLATAAAGPNSPNAPTLIGVAPPPDGTTSHLTATWNAPAVDGSHGAATGYNLRYSPSGAGTWTVIDAVTSPYTITGLTGAAATDVEVQATNAAASPSSWSPILTGTTWGATVAPGSWVPASTQVHDTSVAPSGGVNLTATPSPTAVTGAAFAWSASASVMPSSGLIAAGADGQNNGWGQWFNAPATAGTYYLWLLAQGAGSTTIGALVTAPITVT